MMKDFKITVKAVDRILQREHIGANIELPYNITADVMADMIDAVCVRLRTFIYTEKKSTDVVVDVCVPSNWWQHLIRDNAPAWYLKWFPVKTKTVQVKKNVSFSVLYPEFKPPQNTEKVVIREYHGDLDGAFKTR
jgi:hypothetical protein